MENAKAPIKDWATDFDHTHPAYAQDAPQIWNELRQRCPIARSERFGGMWLPTKSEDIAAIAANENDYYTSSHVVIHEVRNSSPAGVGAAPPITSDPPFHGVARRLLLPAFSPKEIIKLEPFTRRYCHQLCDEIEASIGESRTFDAALRYTQNIPVRVIAEMLGVPSGDGALFRRFINNIIENPVDHDLAPEDRIETYFDQIISRHKANPASRAEGDLIDFLLAAQIDGEPLSHEHVRGTAILLLVAGIDTTWSSIGSSIWHLAQNPQDLARFAQEPELRPFAVEEFLRFYAPVTMARVVARDHELRGRKLVSGDWLLLPFPAHNRDPEAFDDADTFIIDRRKNRHAAFGLGIHRCLGSNLARMELGVALEVFIERFPSFELIDPSTVRFSTGQIRGPRELPLRLCD